MLISKQPRSASSSKAKQLIRHKARHSAWRGSLLCHSIKDAIPQKTKAREAKAGTGQQRC